MCFYCVCSVRKSIAGNSTPASCFERLLCSMDTYCCGSRQLLLSQPRDVRTSDTEKLNQPRRLIEWPAYIFFPFFKFILFFVWYPSTWRLRGYEYGRIYSFQTRISVHLETYKAGGSFASCVTHSLFCQGWERSFQIVCTIGELTPPPVTPRSITIQIKKRLCERWTLFE